MSSKRKRQGDLDSPWKEALEHFLAPFLDLFYPEIHAQIDWRRGYESLDKELQQISHDDRIGRRPPFRGEEPGWAWTTLTVDDEAVATVGIDTVAREGLP